MHDQADQLRKLARASVHADATLAPGGPVIALSGAQAAAGVTTAACGLARELTRLGKQVILIDANLHRPAAANHFTADPRGSLHDVLNGERRAVEVLTPTAEDGLRLLAGCPQSTAPPLDREALERFAAETAALSRQADVVLIDAGHGMNAWIDRLWQLARQVLLVATPTAQSLLDAYAAVKLSQFHRHDRKIRLLVNRTVDESEATPLAKRFDETCQRFLFITPRLASSLPAFADKAAARKDATALNPDDQFDRAVRLLAADLVADIRVAALRLVRSSARAGVDPVTPSSTEGSALHSKFFRT